VIFFVGIAILGGITFAISQTNVNPKIKIAKNRYTKSTNIKNRQNYNKNVIKFQFFYEGKMSDFNFNFYNLKIDTLTKPYFLNVVWKHQFFFFFNTFLIFSDPLKPPNWDFFLCVQFDT